MLREKGCKRKEQRQIEIAGDQIGDYPEGVPDNKTVYDVKKYAEQVIDREFWRAPLPFKGSSDKVVEVQHYRSEKDISVKRQENPCQEPPHLTSQYMVRAES